MTANIPGARLRDVERELATLRGEAAVNQYIEQHPEEMRVLEKMVEWRRAGRQVPSLARVQRVMIWSDGEIELKTDPNAAAPATHESRRGSGRGGPGGPGAGRPSSTNSTAGRGGGAGGPGGQGSFGQRTGSFPGSPAGDRRTGSGPRAGGQGGGPPRRGGPRRPGGRRRDDAEWGTGGVPRSGEGWVLLREGERPPPDPQELVEYEYEYEEEETAENAAPGAEGETPSVSAENEKTPAQ